MMTLSLFIGLENLVVGTSGGFMQHANTQAVLTASRVRDKDWCFDEVGMGVGIGGVEVDSRVRRKGAGQGHVLQ